MHITEIDTNTLTWYTSIYVSCEKHSGHKGQFERKMLAGHIIHNNHTFYICITNDNTLPSTVPILGQKTLLEINFSKFQLNMPNLKPILYFYIFLFIYIFFVYFTVFTNERNCSLVKYFQKGVTSLTYGYRTMETYHEVNRVYRGQEV
jgi:hypothetical protein